MNTRTLFLMCWVFLAASFSPAYGSHVVEPYLQLKDLSSHRSISATVVKVVSDMVFLRTEERTIRNLGVKEVKRDRIPSLQPGDEVDLIVDRGNSLLAIAPPGGKGGFIGDEVTGTVQFFDGFNKRITLKTEEGDIQGFELREAVATKLNGINEGRTVILELDGQNRAMDAYRSE